MRATVSVVVPVYNPGQFIQRCIDSLLAQTMPPGDLEVLFVDDGSTDETPGMLDRLADIHSHVSVIHQQNSGWPGKPRNVGTDAATGDYVMFMDQDDALGPEAMQRMYDFGAHNHADIVIGKVTSNFRPVPHHVWRTNIDKCTLRDHNLIGSLTPHKMFRRQFLLDNDIRYPEGKRRLEDQLFMVQSYLAAERVSVLGDYPCYFYLKRADGGNAGSGLKDVHGYYQNLREVLDVVDSEVEPGAFQDSLLRHFYLSQMRRLLKGSPKRRLAIGSELRDLALTRFTDTVAAGLEAQHRIRAALVREGRFDDLAAFSSRVDEVRTAASVENLQWRDGILNADFSARLVLADGSPVRLEPRDGRRVLDSRIVGDLVPDDLATVRDVDAATTEVVLRHRVTGVEWYVPVEVVPVAATDTRPDVTAGIAVNGHLAVDPLTVAGGSSLQRGVWVLTVRLRGCGLGGRVRPTLVNVAVGRRKMKSPLLATAAITVAPRFNARNSPIVLVVGKGRTTFERIWERLRR